MTDSTTVATAARLAVPHKHTVTALWPGERMPIDSTALDVRVVLDDGTADRIELTMMVDVATRSIPAAVLRPTTKAVDAALLLARAVTPEPMRPGWADALRMELPLTSSSSPAATAATIAPAAVPTTAGRGGRRNRSTSA